MLAALREDVQLALAENTNMTMTDVLRSYAPSVRVRSAGNFVGMPTCVELRSVRATFRNDCLSPAVYLVDRSREDQVWLLLEDVSRVCTWPWRDVVASRAVLQRLAELHAAEVQIPRHPWNYESELQQSALATVEMLDSMRRSPEWSSLAKRGFRPLDRIARSLAPRRAALNTESISACDTP